MMGTFVLTWFRADGLEAWKESFSSIEELEAYIKKHKVTVVRVESSDSGKGTVLNANS